MVFVLGTVPITTVAAVPQEAAFLRLFRHFQSFISPESIDTLYIHLPTVSPQQSSYATITKPRTLTHQLVHSAHQPLLFLLRTTWHITLSATRLTEDFTRPALRNSLLFLDVFDGFPFLRRA